MKRIRFFVLAFSIIFISCTEPPAKTDSPLTYSKDGVSFTYPGNWKVSKDTESKELRYLTIQTKGNAMVVAQIYDTADAVPMKEYAEWFSQSVKENIPIASQRSSTYNNDTILKGQKTYNEKFDIKIMTIDIPHTRIYKRFDSGKKVCYLIGQVSDEDKSKVLDGFTMIFSTFKLSAK